jgi:two-component system, cell cycle response regulator DivK
MKILLVEDDRLNAELARDLLELENHDVEHVADAAGLRARMGRPPPDIVLLDLLLPDGNGVDLYAELRRDESWRTLPIVAVTAQALTGDAERLLELGFDGVLHKPIETRSFVLAVESFVRGGERS